MKVKTEIKTKPAQYVGSVTLRTLIILTVLIIQCSCADGRAQMTDYQAFVENATTYEHTDTALSYRKNKDAVFTFHDKPNTQYSIKVYYTTNTPSAAKGLQDKISDENGDIKWEWRVGNTAAGDDRYIVVTGGGEKHLFTFSVTD